KSSRAKCREVSCLWRARKLRSHVGRLDTTCPGLAIRSRPDRRGEQSNTDYRQKRIWMKRSDFDPADTRSQGRRGIVDRENQTIRETGSHTLPTADWRDFGRSAPTRSARD